MYKTIIQRICKADAKSKLRSFLDRNEPQLVQFLQTLWHNQGRAITYKELRNAILSGQLDEAWLEDWRQDYSRFVQSELLPIWENAMQTGAEETVKKYSYYFNPSEEGVREWVKNHAAAFVTNSTQTQIDGLHSVIRYAVEQEMSADELSRVIRPIVGLTRQQSMANVRYYNSIYNQLTQNGMNPKRAAKQALDKSIRYGQRQHRYRAYNIARTELAFAYNHGALFGIKQAQKLGLMGQVMKRWVTAADERTCAICENLDNAIIGINEDFQYEDKFGNSHRINARLPEADASLVPPAHPSCRCSVAFEEVEVPMTMDDLDFFTEETGSGSRFMPENLESLPQPLTIEPVIFPGTYRAESLPSDENYDTIEEVTEPTHEENQAVSRLRSKLVARKTENKKIFADEKTGEFSLIQFTESLGNYLHEMHNGYVKYLLDSFESVKYVVSYKIKSAFLHKEKDKLHEYNRIACNPKQPSFWFLDILKVNIHELAHDIDKVGIHSWEDKDFLTAIETEEQDIFKEKDALVRYCIENDETGFLSDIISAIYKGDCPRLIMSHPKEYWTDEKWGQERRAKETFANLFALHAVEDKEKLEFIKENFSALYEAFDQMIIVEE